MEAVVTRKPKINPRKCRHVSLSLPIGLTAKIDQAAAKHPGGRTGLIRDVLADYVGAPEFKVVLAGGRPREND